MNLSPSQKTYLARAGLGWRLYIAGGYGGAPNSDDECAVPRRVAEAMMRKRLVTVGEAFNTLVITDYGRKRYDALHKAWF